MQLPFALGPGESSDAARLRVSRLSAVLAAARRTAIYGPLLARAGSEFSGLSPIGIQAYLDNRERFRNPAGSQAPPPPVPYRTLCGSLEDLLRLRTRRATARRVVLRTPLGGRLASEAARDALWRAFELPIFEELVGTEGEVLASECEAHAGFHLHTASAIFEGCYGELVVTSLVALRYPAVRLRTGWVGAISHCMCPCGEAVTRFAPVSIAAVAPDRKPKTLAEPSRLVAVG